MGRCRQSTVGLGAVHPGPAVGRRCSESRIDRIRQVSMFGKPNLGNQTSPGWYRAFRTTGGSPMARPAAKELTERELELMHVYWRHGEQTAAEVRDRLAAIGPDLTYPTVANLIRG